MLKSSAVSKVTRATVFAGHCRFVQAYRRRRSPNNPAINKKRPVPPAAAPVDAATAAAIAAELKATVRTFQGDNPSAVYRYNWWRDSCYLRYQSGNYESVTSDYCHH